MMSSLYLSGMIPPMETLFHVADTNGEEGIVKSQISLNGTSNVMIIGKGDYVNGGSGEDYDSAVAVAFSDGTSEATADQQASPSSPFENLQHYTLEDALYEASILESMFAILIYDPPTDKLIGLYNNDHKWRPDDKKLWKIIKYLTCILRKVFPERFNSSMPEWTLAIGSGDYPHVRKSA